MTSPPRLPSLDLIRGIAVLGILAINIAGFAGPPSATYGPSPALAATPADGATYALGLLLFEGKMRGLFALLFGASMELFVTRMDAAGLDGTRLQRRRLGWLAGFGYLHFALLWWGDILFTYAIAGFAALALRRLPARALLAGGLLLFAGWQLDGALEQWPAARAEARIGAGTADAGDRRTLADARAGAAVTTAYYTAAARRGFAAQVARKLAEQPFAPVDAALFELGEVLPFMLLGVALLRGGFFAERWPPARLTRLARASLALGGGVTLGFVGWAWTRGFPFAAMRLAIDHALGFPHLLMTLGYAALLVRYAPGLMASGPGRRLVAAGRMAFSNYLGTTLVMTAIFSGWGLGLAGHVGSAAQAGFVVLGWGLMLGWSTPWLARFRAGPLEWLWRSLTFGRVVPLMRT